ncbi:hypothetical protein GCM10009744_00570 [Kribbella alba]|uniref:Uncharacterized protein n=1 Tax=Kribbella alba TaxID=190197 RepID=A0ABN2EUJ2_9ACTN
MQKRLLLVLPLLLGAAFLPANPVSVEVDTGPESLIQLSAGFFGHGQDVWLQVDDVVLEEIR